MGNIQFQIVQPLSVYIAFIYGVSFWFLYFIVSRSIGKASLTNFSDAFYMLATFSACKATAVMIGLALDIFNLEGHWLSQITANLSGMFSVVANVFLFQAALNFLLFKHATKSKFRVVPLLIFSGYLFLYITGIIGTAELDRIGRLSFGYNSALLIGIAMFNIHYSLKERSFGLIFAGSGFILYALTEGIILNPLWGIDVIFLRLATAFVLTASSFSITSLVKGKRLLERIAYV